MSDTLKDRPDSVKLNDPRQAVSVTHDHEHFGRTGVNFFGQPYGYANHCTADEPAVNSSNADPMQRPPCVRDLGWKDKYTYSRPTRNDAREGFWAPARQAERSTLRSLRDEFNTWGDVEEDYVLPDDHHHGSFGGGRWS